MEEVATMGEYLLYRPFDSMKTSLDCVVEDRLRKPARSALEIELEKILTAPKKVRQ